MQTFMSKYYVIGFGISVVVAVPAYVMHWEINERKRNTEKIESLKHTSQHVCHLEKLVERRARIIYQEETKMAFFQRKEHFTVDWDDVEIIHEKPEQARILDTDNVKIDLYNVLVRTIYKNNSKAVQHHKLTAEQKIVYGCESSITKGYTSEYAINLSIPVPSVITDIGAGISKTFTIKLADKYSEEKHYTWGVEDCIQVPGNSTMTVEKRTKEKETEYEFKTRLGFRGNVKGTFYNPKQQKIRTFTIPMKTIINKEMPQDRIVINESTVTEDLKGTDDLKAKEDLKVTDDWNANEDLKVTDDLNAKKDLKRDTQDIDYIIIQGKIKYKYNVEHDVIITNQEHSGCTIV